MKRLMIRSLPASLCLAFSFCMPLHADDFDPRAFARTYFELWTATQAPTATAADLERYLALLTDDVGHQHLPYDPDDSRSPEGKQSIREGMTHYLGKHIEYEARLISVSYGLNAVAIQFEVVAAGKRGPDAPVEHLNFNTMEVLELENGKVSMIRKYN